jgi:hypothetical protein
MRFPNSSVVTALQQQSLKSRTFIYIVAKDRGTGDPAPAGFWNDVGGITAPVIDGITGATVARDFFGSGRLIGIDNIPLTSDISVRTIKATLSQVDQTTQDAVRLYDAKFAPVQIYRGIYDPATHLLIDAAVCRFVGFIDQIDILTPQEGNPGQITATMVSHSREMTKESTDVRSDQSQQARFLGDTFYADTGVVGDWQIFWGSTQGKA